jgi:hypothetical protein
LVQPTQRIINAAYDYDKCDKKKSMRGAPEFGECLFPTAITTSTVQDLK